LRGRFCGSWRPSSAGSVIAGCTFFCAEGHVFNRKKTQRLYREEGLTVRKRKGRKRATGMRTPILVVARPNARWSVDFVHDQLSNGRRFRILIDDTTKECLAAIADTSISGWRVARELDVIIAGAANPI
jgi:putative transposase